jgi:hypothetical protein
MKIYSPRNLPRSAELITSVDEELHGVQLVGSNELVLVGRAACMMINGEMHRSGY